MATVANLAAALAAATNVPKPEVCQRIRALREAGELPTAPSRHDIPHVTFRQAALTLLAVLAGGAVKDTVSRAREYDALPVRGDTSIRLGGLLAEEFDRAGAEASAFEELILIEEPAAAVVWHRTADAERTTMRFGTPHGPRWTQRHFRRDGLDVIARALDS